VLLTAFLALAQAPEPPRTVNDGILGRAEDFLVRGPARICLGTTSLDLEVGETSYLDYLGIHWGSIRIVGRNGTFLIKEGDAWASPKGGRAFGGTRGEMILQVGGPSNPKYLIYARTSYSNEEQPRVWVEGSALGRGRDRQILSRIRVSAEPPKECDRQFDYGWDFLLPPAEVK
jgi:hypothetical protein